MSTTLDPTLRNLNDCECCEGVSAETPLNVSNRPGLSAIAYRAGTHAQFKESMLARLSGLRLPSLEGLKARTDGDFSIALLDAFATVADVLTFYQERLANEAYLRTATERRSVLELARLIDYQLRPGVAASTYLAFTVEDAPGALGQSFSLGSSAQIAPEASAPIVVDIGIKVQSIPGPGEQAQMFETVEKIEARPEWNAIKPRLTQPQLLSVDMPVVYLEGATLNIKQGDQILLADSAGKSKVRTVGKATSDEKARTTRLDLLPIEPIVTTTPTPIFPGGQVSTFLFRTALNQGVIGNIIGGTWNGYDLSAVFNIQRWSARQFTANINKQLEQTVNVSPDAGVFAFRQRAAVFGYNAPLYNSLPGNLRHATTLPNSDPVVTISAAYPDSWETRTLEADSAPSGGACSIFLDNSYPTIVKGSWLALTSPNVEPAVLKVKDNQETTRTDYTISAKVSRLTVEPCGPLANFKIRGTTVLAQSEQLTLAKVPIEQVVENDTITLDGPYFGLQVGQKLIITGELHDLKGVIASEAGFIKDASLVGGFTVVTLQNSLAYKYVRSTTSINANVALATHGETVKADPNAWGEVLGNGDASQTFQRFMLRQPPLTYTSASNPSGGETTLKVRVNDILWHEVRSFLGYGPEDRVYVTRTDDDGKTTVIFGDGKTGARLPTGQGNVQARYRKGIGLGGLVHSNQLTLLMTRVLGLKSVTNPIEPKGAADPERLENARRNAPLTILTLDRVVSLQDYEDFARGFSGIGKALATWTWFGQSRGIFLTVAGANGATVDKDFSKTLLAAIRNAGDPAVAIKLESYRPRFFRIRTGIRLDPDYLPEKVLAEIEQQLRDSFSFEARAFGQPLQLSEVMLVIQSVKGVVAADIDELYRTDEQAQHNARIEAAFPRQGDQAILAAELLTLDPRPVDLEVLM